jgi:UPF0755 protein
MTRPRIVKKIIGISVATTLLAVGVGVAIAWMSFLRTAVVFNDQGVKYKVRAGASFKSVVADLNAQHVIEHPYFFMLLASLKGDVHLLKKGEYLFPKGATAVRILNQMVTGTGLVQHSFTLITGWNFRQLRQALNKDEALEHATKELDDEAIMKRLGYANLHPEGQFFPDTYYFIADSTDLALLKRAFQVMQNKMQQAWQQRSPTIPFKTPYEALIAASIIEKEAYLDVERPIIAGVLVNRLHKNMLLQFDPTVIYGLGTRYDGKIYKHDLVEDTPYNSYVHKGLPPTPIAMPGMHSIQAALHPSVHNYFYFVATGDHASHHFSASLSEHVAAISAAKTYQYYPWFFNAELIKSYLRKQLFLSQVQLGTPYAPEITPRRISDYRRY